MGVLDFFFGRTKPTPTTTTTVQSSKLPEEIAPYVKDVLAEAQRLYNEGKERGYEEYPGMTIAPRTPAEEEAIAGLRGLIGTQDTYLQEAEAALRGIPQEFTTEQAEKFMSPYQQAVIDIEKRKAEEDFQRKIMPAFEKQAVQAGGMSGLGSRAGVQAARLGEAFSQQLGDIQSKGQQKAYEDAYKRFQDQMAMDRTRAADLQGIGLTKFQTGLAEQGLAQQLAQADRQEMQATLDEQYEKYLEREQYPKQELAQLSSFVYGNPFLRTPDRTISQQAMLQPTSSIGQGLLGLGLTGLNIYGRGLGANDQWSMANFGRSFTGKKYGGRVVQRQEGGGRIVYKQDGGGLGSLPVINRRGAGSTDPRVFYSDNERDAINEVPTNNADLTSRLKETLASLAAKQGTSGYGKSVDDLLSGELAKRQADRRKEAREEVIKSMKEAMPKSQRLSGLLVAAKRVMGADPSKGFINAIVEGMAGLDEAQQEDYLRQKEQELKIIELEGKGKMEDLTALEAAETEAAKFPIKIAKLKADKLKNQFDLSKDVTKKVELMLNNADELARNPGLFKAAFAELLALIPGNKANIGNLLMNAITKEIMSIHGGDAGPQGLPSTKRKSDDPPSLVRSKEETLEKLGE